MLCSISPSLKILVKTLNASYKLDSISYFYVTYRMDKKYTIQHYLMTKPTVEMYGARRGFGDLGRMAVYFQGAGEHW